MPESRRPPGRRLFAFGGLLGNNSYGSFQAMLNNLPFTIDEWSDDGLTLIACHAKADNHYVAMAAFSEAKKQYENRPLTLRQGTMVHDKHNMPERKELQPRSVSR